MAVTDRPEAENSADSRGSDARLRRPVMLVVLALLLLAEAAVVLVVGIAQLAQIGAVPPDSLATAVALIALVLIAGIWVLAIAVGVFRMRPWSRAAALTWQVIQIIVAVCCFQGIFATPDDGWPLLIAGVLGIGLVLSPSVVAVTRRDA